MDENNEGLTDTEIREEVDTYWQAVFLHLRVSTLMPQTLILYHYLLGRA